ncbi:hypothetical protein [Paramicrobacterium chengjingii]|uniref:Uncharacterized protein n=1 Tax=Paramicrobacterium chengjingii TaxID=2769067 RepID=A0ABX6YLA5_9MICO|nr:hypothetical protein [Microbacterium chengjingii]QPZ39528.1 hypothetical protein HCR76_05585 [Microbacterium chengjingii]
MSDKMPSEAWQREVMDDAMKRVWEVAREATKDGPPYSSKVIEDALQAVADKHASVGAEQSTAIYIWAVVALDALTHALDQQAIHAGAKNYYEFYVSHVINKLEGGLGGENDGY